MAFPSLSGSLPITLESGWEQARSNAAAIKAQCQNLLAQAQGAGIAGNVILTFTAHLDTQSTQFATIGAIPGMGSYAQAQVGNPSLDVAAAFNAMTSAIANLIAWVRANFPKDGNGNLLYAQFAPSGGQIQYPAFTSTQLSGFATQLSAL